MSLDTRTLDIRTESPLTPAARALIEASQAEMEEVYPPEEIFSLSPEELAAPNTQFLVARLDDQPIGCIALVDMVRYGEIKRLFVGKSARGLGLGRALVAEVERSAREIGLRVLRLETGPELTAAVAVYERAGFAERDAFGDYEDQPCSLFMEKRLA